MKQRIIAIVTSLSVAAMIIGPAPVQAVTAAELQAQIDALLAQLATLQTQLAGLTGEGVTVTGCTITSFDRNLKEGMSGDDVKCLQIVLNTAADTQLASSGVGSSGNETSYFGPLTKAAVIKFQEKYASEVLASWGLTAGTGFVGSTTRTKLNSILATGEVPTPVTPTGKGLTVTLAADTPVTSTLVSGTTTGQSVAPLAKFTLTNGDNAEVKLTKLKLKRLGVSEDATLTNVYLFDGAIRLTDAASVSSGVITFTESTGIVKIAAGASKTITVKADIGINASGQTVGVGINAATDVTTNASSVNGTFPINGNLMSTASGTLAGVDFRNITPSAGTVDPQDDYVVWQGNAVVTTRAVNFTRISFREIGTVNYADLQNFRLYADGVQVGSAVENLDDNGYVTFDLSAEPKKLETGTRIIKLMADIIGGSDRTFTFHLRVAADANFVDSQYGVSILPTADSAAFHSMNSCGTTGCTISYGIVTISKKSGSPVDVIDGTAAETLAEFEIKAAGERVKIETLTIGITFTNNTVGDDDDGTVTLRNGMLTANGVQVGSTKHLTEATNVSFPLGSSLIVEPGSPVTLKILADIYDRGGNYNDIQADDVIKATIIKGTGNAQGMVSLRVSNIPSATTGVSGNEVTVESGGLRLAKYTAYPDKTLVAPLTAAKLSHFTLTAKDEAININTIVVNLSDVTGGVDASDDLSNLYVAYGANTTTVKPTASDGNNSWSINYELAKHDVIDLIVYADVASTAYEGVEDTITPTIDISGVAAESATTVDVDTVTGQKITFSGGDIISAVAGDTPLDQIVSGSSAADIAAGTPKQVTAAKFKFTAVNDDYTISYVDVKVGSATISGVIAKAILKDGTTVLAESPFNLESGGQDNRKARLYLSPDAEVPANTSKTLTVDLALSQPSADTSTSQVNAKITLAKFKYANSQGVEGEDTNDRAANNLYVFQSIPTFTQEVLSGQYITDGTKSLYKFKIAADSKGPVSVKQLKFNVVITDPADNSTPKLSAFKLLRGSQDISTSVRIQDTSGGSLEGTTSVEEGTTPIVVTFNTEETIGAGQVQSYTLKATAAGFAASTSGNDSVAVNLMGDADDDSQKTSKVYLIGTGSNGTGNTTVQKLGTAVDGLGTNSDYNVIWSDESAVLHKYTSGYVSATDYCSKDWTNGYLVLNLPLDAQGWISQ